MAKRHRNQRWERSVERRIKIAAGLVGLVCLELELIGLIHQTFRL